MNSEKSQVGPKYTGETFRCLKGMTIDRNLACKLVTDI